MMIKNDKSPILMKGKQIGGLAGKITPEDHEPN